MHQVIEAIIDELGRVILSEPLELSGNRRALVIVLDDSAISPSSTRHWLPGALQSEGVNRYRIEKPLSTSGMGEAFIGTDLQSRRTVCIKRLRPIMRNGTVARVCRTHARVQSKYVVSLLDLYEHDDSLYLVMEYINGPTLAERLAVGLRPAEISWLGLTLMRGVQAIHKQGVIHCDLKPQNILIQYYTLEVEDRPGWVPKIIDFDLALISRYWEQEDGNRGHIGFGTPAYMAPEQISDCTVCEACDIYAVGLILYEAITGQPAFAGAPHSIMAAKVAQTEGLRVAHLPPDIPSIFGVLVERCTNPSPMRRPSATEVVKSLESALDYTAE